jgi:hypothetical protein
MFFEAHGARLFFDAGFHIDAKQETGTKGEDFDFIAIRDGDRFNVEVTVVRFDQFRRRKVFRRLYREIGQVSEDGSSAIVCVRPESWFNGVTDLNFHFMSIAFEFFARVPRANAVIFLGERHVDLSGGIGARGALVFPLAIHANPQPTYPAPSINFLFEGNRRRNLPPRRGMNRFIAFDRLAEELRSNEFYRWVDHLISEAESDTQQG